MSILGISREAYLQRNHAYWKRGYKGYPGENVESFIFRPYGRIIEKYFEGNKSKTKKMLDFGCGAGMSAMFYGSKGFDVHGVDISEFNIQCCKQRMPQIADHFSVIDPIPSENNNFWGGNFDLVIAIQSLYYFSDTHLQTALRCLYHQMNPGGIIYAAMIGKKCWCYEHSVKWEDGLRKFEVDNQRVKIDYHYVNFIEDEEDLLKKFSLFKKLHVGFYSERYREDEGVDFHYTFVGQK